MMVFIRLIVVKSLKFLILAGVAFIACAVFACEEFCEEPNRTAIVVAFYSLETEEEAAASVSIKGVDNDSILYTRASYRQVLLPINPGVDEMKFSVEKDDAPADTIVFRYTLHPGFISVECGCAGFAQLHEAILDSVDEDTEHTIKELEITDPSVRTVSYRQGVYNDENIRIYY